MVHKNGNKSLQRKIINKYINIATFLVSAGQEEKPISLREAAAMNGVLGAQGNTLCHCK